MIEVTNAHGPKFNADGTIDLMVQFSHLQEEVVFTASPSDPMEHGRQAHARALAGEFGPVAPYVVPTAYELAARDNPPLRTNKMAEAVDSATHWDMMGDPVQAAAWRAHYQALYALEQSPEWPLVEQWPTAPALAA